MANIDVFCDSHVYYKDHHFCYTVSCMTTIEDLKWSICDNWRMLVPTNITVNYLDNGVKVPLLNDISLHGMAALHFAKKSHFFNLYVEVINSGASGSSRTADVNRNTEMFLAAKQSYARDGEVPKRYISDTWDHVFDDVGQLFYGGVETIRLGIQKYIAKTGYKIKYTKNVRERVTAKCSIPGCSFDFHATALDDDHQVFKIIRYTHRHSCGVGIRLRSPTLSRKLVDSVIHDQVAHNPLMKPAEIMNYFSTAVGLTAKYHHAYHGLETSHKKIFGDEVKSYTHLAWYVTALMETNPGSVIKFDYHDKSKRFHRLFICLGACKEGYKLLRPMIFVDATFLNGRFKGGLMAATCLNGRQGFYPLAYALVPGEDKDNWNWFLRQLKKCLDDRPVTFISDRADGLLAGIPDVFGRQAHHSYCFWHLKKNLPIKKGDVKRKKIEEAFQKATYALCPATYEEALQELEIMDRGDVATYLRDTPRECWSSAFFTGCRYGYVSSSVAESFNSWIQPEKKLPHYGLSDNIRRRMMEMMSERRDEIPELDPSLLTPEYQALLEEHINIGQSWHVSKSAENVYEVHSPSSHMVDLNRKSCTCQRWKVYGFPCTHACAAIRRKGENYHSYIEYYFTAKCYIELYSLAIRPVPNYDRPNEYTEEDTVNPPLVRNPPGRGRSKENRFRGPYERRKKAYKCGNCGLRTRHNKATCGLIRQYMLTATP